LQSPFAVGSAMLCATTLNVPAVAPALKRPVSSIVLEPVVVQVTAVFAVPWTVAANWTVSPATTVVDDGLTSTTTGAGSIVSTSVSLPAVAPRPTVAWMLTVVPPATDGAR